MKLIWAIKSANIKNEMLVLKGNKNVLDSFGNYSTCVGFSWWDKKWIKASKYFFNVDSFLNKVANLGGGESLYKWDNQRIRRMSFLHFHHLWLVLYIRTGNFISFHSTLFDLLLKNAHFLLVKVVKFHSLGSNAFKIFAPS